MDNQIAIITDVHGNIKALNTVLEDTDKELGQQLEEHLPEFFALMRNNYE